MLSGQKLPGYRFPLDVIGYAVWLYHRFTLSYRNVEELLLERGICVTRESIRAWCITFSDLFAQGLRHREPRRGSRWHLDDMHVDVGGVTHGLWRAVDEHGVVLDVVFQRNRDTEAATAFFSRLLGEHGIPASVHTDTLWSYGAALRKLPVLHAVERIQVVSTARCNNLTLQSHRLTRRQARQQRGFRSRRRPQGVLDLHARITNLHHSARCTVPAHHRRYHQTRAFALWRDVVTQVA